MFIEIEEGLGETIRMQPCEYPRGLLGVPVRMADKNV